MMGHASFHRPSRGKHSCHRRLSDTFLLEDDGCILTKQKQKQNPMVKALNRLKSPSSAAAPMRSAAPSAFKDAHQTATESKRPTGKSEKKKRFYSFDLQLSKLQSKFSSLPSASASSDVKDSSTAETIGSQSSLEDSFSEIDATVHDSAAPVSPITPKRRTGRSPVRRTAPPPKPAGCLVSGNAGSSKPTKNVRFPTDPTLFTMVHSIPAKTDGEVSRYWYSAEEMLRHQFQTVVDVDHYNATETNANATQQQQQQQQRFAEEYCMRGLECLIDNELAVKQLKERSQISNVLRRSRVRQLRSNGTCSDQHRLARSCQKISEDAVQRALDLAKTDEKEVASCKSRGLRLRKKRRTQESDARTAPRRIHSRGASLRRTRSASGRRSRRHVDRSCTKTRPQSSVAASRSE